MANILTEIYEEEPTAQHYGSYLSMYCPWHDGWRRSLMCYEDWFRCLSCGAEGKPQELLRKISSGFVIIEPTKFINPWRDWLYNNSIEEVLTKAHKLVKDHPSQAQYWKSRGVSKNHIKKLGLGWLDGYNTIPIRNESKKIVGGVARASDTIESPAKYVTPSRFHQNNSELLYVPSWKRLGRSERVFLAFGIISAMAIHFCGEAACAPLTGKQVNINILKEIRKPIMIVPDYGERKEALKLADSLGWRGKVLDLPYHNDILDPADMWLEEPEKLRGVLNV